MKDKLVTISQSDIYRISNVRVAWFAYIQIRARGGEACSNEAHKFTPVPVIHTTPRKYFAHFNKCDCLYMVKVRRESLRDLGNTRNVHPAKNPMKIALPASLKLNEPKS